MNADQLFLPRIWISRLLVAIVLFNVQCALAFLIAPQLYSSGFELDGAVGEGVVRGMGILFLMWNVPYVVAAAAPYFRRTSLLEASVMQAIGFVGESLLLAGLPGDHPVLHQTVGRFILFDGAGLAALLAAVWLTHPLRIGILEKSHAGKN